MQAVRKLQSVDVPASRLHLVANDENVDAGIVGSIGDQWTLRLRQHLQAQRPRNALAQTVDRLGGPSSQVTIARLAEILQRCPSCGIGAPWPGSK